MNIKANLIRNRKMNEKINKIKSRKNRWRRSCAIKNNSSSSYKKRRKNSWLGWDRKKLALNLSSFSWNK